MNPIVSNVSEEDNVGLQMQKILQLMSDRASGKASSDEVETAVQSLLVDVAALTPAEVSEPKSATLETITMPKEIALDIDEQDYDDEGEEFRVPDQSVPSAATNEHDAIPLAAPVTAQAPALPAKRKRGRPRKTVVKESVAEAIDWSVYAEIPLGKQGAQMLTTFGDGPRPRPETVAACLLGARRMLQVAIQDARYLRRKNTGIYQAAKHAIKPQKMRKSKQDALPMASSAGKVGKNARDELTPEILYKATVGFDRLSSAPLCGFDEEDIRLLYPEEMNAYQQWSHLHEEYAQKLKEEQSQQDDEGDEDEETDQNSTVSQSSQPLNTSCGHIAERMAQFDLRTDRMKEDWYLQFADLRQGSFLPRDFTAQKAQSKAWKEYQSESGNHMAGKNRGRKPKSYSLSWANMSLASARFLHWLGFDMDTLPPPNDETTSALAFLAYDFFGRIVEKAIDLRNAAEGRKKGQGSEASSLLLELGRGEQLEATYVELALKDINPTALYSAASEKKVEPQLYFGPGFEDRLEMEMEELLSGLKEKQLSEDEIQARRAEDELFARMANPPTRDSVATLLEEHSETIKRDKVSGAKKARGD